MKIEIFKNFQRSLAFVEELRSFLSDFFENNSLKLFKSFVANLALKPLKSPSLHNGIHEILLLFIRRGRVYIRIILNKFLFSESFLIGRMEADLVLEFFANLVQSFLSGKYSGVLLCFIVTTEEIKC